MGLCIRYADAPAVWVRVGNGMRARPDGPHGTIPLGTQQVLGAPNLPLLEHADFNAGGGGTACRIVRRTRPDQPAQPIGGQARDGAGGYVDGRAWRPDGRRAAASAEVVDLLWAVGRNEPEGVLERVVIRIYIEGGTFRQNVHIIIWYAGGVAPNVRMTDSALTQVYAHDVFFNFSNSASFIRAALSDVRTLFTFCPTPNCGIRASCLSYCTIAARSF